MIYSLRNLLKVCNPQHRTKFNAHKCSKIQAVKGPPWRILFFGTDQFSLPSLKALCSKLRTGTLISSLGVVTKKHSPVCDLSEAEQLPLYYWPVVESQIKFMYDIGMVVSFGNLINEAIINALPLGCINVHASLLPRWRGAAPIVHAILAGDNETGVTIMRIHPHKFDIGEIVRQYRICIGKHETAEELGRKLAMHGSNLLMECLRDLPKCVEMAVPQPKVGITYAKKIDQKMSYINWRVTTAESLYNLHRGLSHLYCMKTSWHGLTVKFRNLYLDPQNKEITKEETHENGDSKKSALDFLLDDDNKKCKSNLNVVKAIEAGKCLFDKENRLLKVTCADGHKVVISKLQVGNKVMTGVDFYNGFMTKRKQSEWKFVDL